VCVCVRVEATRAGGTKKLSVSVETFLIAIPSGRDF